MSKNNIEEEVTITPIIKDLERIFHQIIHFISSIFILIYKAFVSFFRFCFKHFLFLFIFMVIGGFIGYFSSEFVAPIYTSELILDLNIESKSQLTADVNYINSLIESEEFNTLSKLFSISVAEASSLKELQISGSSTYPQKMEGINNFYVNLDTNLQKKVDIDAFLITNTGEFDNRYTITLEAIDKHVFSKLEPGMLAFFERIPELEKLRVNTIKNLEYKKDVFVSEMKQFDTLKKVMNEVMIQQAKSANDKSTTNISLGNTEHNNSMQLLEIYNRYLNYSREVILLDEQINDLENIYEVHAHFSKLGVKSSLKRKESTLVFASIFFLLGVLLLLLNTARKNVLASDV